jgi:hypothetical protein
VWVPRHIAWEYEYRNRRYLADITAQELIERTRYLVENLVTVTPEGKIGVLQATKIGDSLWKAFTQTWLEIKLRGNVDLTNFLKDSAVPKPRYPEGSPGRRAYQQRRDRRVGQFFKFGRLEHLARLVSEGAIRLNPASFYNDPSLNSAVRDDELQIERVSMPGTTLITLPNGTIIGKNPGEVRDFRMRYTHTTNFYVWCVSSFFHDRLFDDFHANASLVLHDMKAFLTALKSSLSHTDLGLWDFSFSEVSYLDPYNWPTDLSAPVIPFCKHHKYSYQHEYRIVIHPTTPIRILDPVDLTIDLPDGCAELIAGG